MIYFTKAPRFGGAFLLRRCWQTAYMGDRENDEDPDWAKLANAIETSRVNFQTFLERLVREQSNDQLEAILSLSINVLAKYLR